MSSLFKKISLGKKPRDYALECFTFFPILQSQLLPLLNFDQGKWHMFAPASALRERVNNFKSGGLFLPRVTGLDHGPQSSLDHQGPVPKPKNEAECKTTTDHVKESLKPHLQNGAPLGPHWDWTRREEGSHRVSYRIFPDQSLMPVSDAADYPLRDHIFHALEKDPQNICIFLDFYPINKSEVINKGHSNAEKFRTHFVNEKLSCYLLSSRNSKDDIIEVIDKSYQPLVHMGFITKIPTSRLSLLNEPYQDLTPDDFISFAHNFQYLILGAYDGESYIIWEKDNLKRHNVLPKT